MRGREPLRQRRFIPARKLRFFPSNPDAEIRDEIASEIDVILAYQAELRHPVVGVISRDVLEQRIGALTTPSAAIEAAGLDDTLSTERARVHLALARAYADFDAGRSRQELLVALELLHSRLPDSHPAILRVVNELCELELETSPDSTPHCAEAATRLERAREVEPSLRSAVYFNQSKLSEVRGDPAGAYAFGIRALAAAETLGTPDPLWGAYFRLARVLDARDERALAIFFGKRSIAEIDRLSRLREAGRISPNERVRLETLLAGQGQSEASREDRIRTLLEDSAGPTSATMVAGRTVQAEQLARELEIFGPRTALAFYLLTENGLRIVLATRDGQSEYQAPIEAAALRRDIGGPITGLIVQPSGCPSATAGDGALRGEGFADAAFTEARVRTLLTAPREFSVLHLGTHFSLRPGNAVRSFLLLGDGARLTLDTIGTLDFSGLELMTLSACETAMGGAMTDDGREVEGLSALVQRRGAKRVIASLWQVEDVSTARLMREMYGSLSSASGDAAEALRRAQQSLRDVKRKGARPYEHPYYWAGFVISSSQP